MNKSFFIVLMVFYQYESVVVWKHENGFRIDPHVVVGNIIVWLYK